MLLYEKIVPVKFLYTFFVTCEVPPPAQAPMQPVNGTILSGTVNANVISQVTRKCF